MKDNKGFTLTELLAVIVLMAIISTIAVAGTSVVRKQIKVKLWSSTKKLIENGASTYGGDNENLLKESCIIEGISYDCLTNVSIQTLIDKNYITVKSVKISEENPVYTDTSLQETYKCETKNSDSTNEIWCKVLVNDTLDQDDPDYILNGMHVIIYKQAGRIYVDLSELESTENED
jgi:prepilin-type N-terminal cleavage/methylation domain-containing protein